MFILGLTGSIGMGKSTAAAALRRLGVPVHDADRSVHRLLGKGGRAVPLVARAFPGTVRDGAVDRLRLGAIVFADARALKRLEAILHPLVRREERAFLAAVAHRRAPVAVLDVPLLYETGGERRCDAVVLVTAPEMVQMSRVLSRPGMTMAKLAGIRSRQMPDRAKRARADFIVPTGLSKREAARKLACAVAAARRRRGRHWRPERPGVWGEAHA